MRLPATTEEELSRLYSGRDFAHFLELRSITTCALQTEGDFRQVVVDYAVEAAARGAVYLEGSFSQPSERGALCDEETRERLRELGDPFAW